ncbi:hypothetical protein BH10ACT1_BH10ACT1_41660 [soil metagenome]
MAVAGSFPDPSRSGPPDTLSIDCDQCALQHTEACADCIVTFLCGVEASTPVVVDLAEARALRVLDEAGLAPPLRHRRRTG